MTDSKTQQEPSMEEILASIRRIISEDGSEEEKSGSDEPETNSMEEPSLALAEDDDNTSTSVGAEDDDVLELSDVVEDLDDAGDETEADEPLEELDGDFGFEIRDAAADDPFPEAPPVDESAADSASSAEPPPAPAPARPMTDDDDNLLSPTAESAAGAAFARLMEQKASQEATLAAKASLGRGEQTLEDIVKELLRPMLREWLDAHLPTIVERVVEREVERLGRSADRR